MLGCFKSLTIKLHLICVWCQINHEFYVMYLPKFESWSVLILKRANSKACCLFFFNFSIYFQRYIFFLSGNTVTNVVFVVSFKTTFSNYGSISNDCAIVDKEKVLMNRNADTKIKYIDTIFHDLMLLSCKTLADCLEYMGFTDLWHLQKILIGQRYFWGPIRFFSKYFYSILKLPKLKWGSCQLMFHKELTF